MSIQALTNALSTLTAGRIVAWRREGASWRHDVVTACKSCNSSKGAKHFEEWWPTTLRYRRASLAQ